VHVAAALAGVVVFTPLTAALVRASVGLSGSAVIADQQILEFLLTPIGAAALVVLAAVLITIVAIEQTALMTIGFAELQGWRLSAWQAIAFALRRAVDVLRIALRLAGRALLIVAPFLAAAGAIYAWLLSDYDINYYLAARPAEFWIAALLIGSAIVTMLVLLLRRLSEWALALPLMLFAPTGPADALVQSEQQTAGRRLRVVKWWLLWGVFAVAVQALVGAVLYGFGDWVVPSDASSIGTVLSVLAAMVVLATVAGVFVSALQAATFALLTLAMFDRWIPRIRELTSTVAVAARAQPMSLGTRRAIAWGLVGAVGLALLAAYSLVNTVQPLDTVEIIAHRGAAGRAPENTLASVRAAIEDGADWIEIDVQETADGEVVVVHDSDFMKLAGVNLKVWNGTFEQIRAIDVGGWFGAEFAGERVPTLAEVLGEAAHARARVVIELKYYGHDQQLEQRVAEIVEAAGMVDRVAIMSLDYRGVQKFRALRPDWPVGVLMARGLGRTSELDADFLAVNAGMARRHFIRAAHAAGKQVYVWTINDPVAMSSMVSLGVDALITDEPALARRVLAERTELNAAERLLLHAAHRFDWLEPRSTGRDASP
ncbi:MAG TPA: glycerophosphodiester phosphodiesterase, partial [Steroidobacteraceae bacterium]|nr:glycerophosphodiester phosphodiesterase [Steroidobacteraceae bacterium]